jgi:methyl coenzyme M reductase gamma subunit
MEKEAQQLVLDLLKQQQLQAFSEDEEYNKGQTQERLDEFLPIWKKIQEQIKKKPESSTYMDFISHYNDSRLIRFVQQLSFLLYHEGYSKGYTDGIDDTV